MTDNQRYTRYAEKKAGTNNKFYEVEAIQEDDRVRYFFRWGRIGTKGQEKEHRATSFAYAKSVCDEQFNRKLNKGYREVMRDTADNVVMLALTWDDSYNNCSSDLSESNGWEVRDFVDLFPNSANGNICDSSYAAFFSSAIPTIEGACDTFVPVD